MKLLPVFFLLFSEFIFSKGLLTKDIDRFQKKRIRDSGKLYQKFSFVDSLIFPKVKVTDKVDFKIPPLTATFYIAVENRKTKKTYYVSSLKGPHGILIDEKNPKKNKVFNIYQSFIDQKLNYEGPPFTNLLVPNSSLLKDLPIPSGTYSLSLGALKLKEKTKRPPYVRVSILIKRFTFPEGGIREPLGTLKVRYILPKKIFAEGSCIDTKDFVKKIKLEDELKLVKEKFKMNKFILIDRISYIDIPCKDQLNEMWKGFTSFQEKFYFKNIQKGHGSEVNVILVLHKSMTDREKRSRNNGVTAGLASTIAGPNFMGPKRNGVWIDLNPDLQQLNYMSMRVPIKINDIIRHELGHYLGLNHRWMKIPIEGADTIDNIMGYGPVGYELLNMRKDELKKLEKLVKEGFGPFVEEQERIITGHPAVILYRRTN